MVFFSSDCGLCCMVGNVTVFALVLKQQKILEKKKNSERSCREDKD